MFVQFAFGGPIFSIPFALITFLLLRFTKHVDVKVFLFTIMFCVFGSFFWAETSLVGFQVSGVLAVVFYAFFAAAVGHKLIQKNGGDHLAHEHHAVIGFVAGLCNDTLFFLAGFPMFRYLFDAGMGGNEWAYLCLLYVYCHVARAVSVFGLMPIMSFFGFGVSWKEALIGVLGGLRGAVGIAMALQVALDHSDSPLDIGFRLRIGFYVSGTYKIFIAIVLYVYVARNCRVCLFLV